MTATVVGLFLLGLLFVGKAADWLQGPDDSEPTQWPPWASESSDRGSEP